MKFNYRHLPSRIQLNVITTAN
eukprot:Gb_25527 [translate_table: standard]